MMSSAMIKWPDWFFEASYGPATNRVRGVNGEQQEAYIFKTIARAYV